MKIGTYNIEWFDHQFEKDNTLKTFDPSNKEEKKLLQQREAIVKVLQTLDFDLLGIVEGPNTTTTTGEQSTVKKLNNFLQYANLTRYETMTGYISAGSQELAIIYDKDKLDVTHKPGGTDTKKNPPFDGVFEHDTDDDKIKELYEFYRPPLEAEVKIKATGDKFYVIVAHTKSKGIFSSMDMVHWKKENERSRRKLFAECTWIRRRVDQFLKEGKDVVVMGDINDGPGMDFYEMQFGRSAVELIMGDIFYPDSLLRNYVGAPTWGTYGWEPSSTRFIDRFTETPINALIDHILVSKGLSYSPNSHKVWNPYIKNNKPYYEPKTAAIKFDLLNASDHFPVTIDLV